MTARPRTRWRGASSEVTGMRLPRCGELRKRQRESGDLGPGPGGLRYSTVRVGGRPLRRVRGRRSERPGEIRELVSLTDPIPGELELTGAARTRSPPVTE
eukprot:337476-Hanusia_phi.AAC.1